MDPLSDVLSLLKPRSCVAGGFGATDHLAIQFPNYQGIKCYAVVAGQCWLSVDNVADPVLLTAGDCFLLPRGWPFSLATDLSIKPVDFHILLADMQNARANAHIALHEDGASCYIVGGYFRLTATIPKSCSALCRPSCIFAKTRIKRLCAGRLSV